MPLTQHLTVATLAVLAAASLPHLARAQTAYLEAAGIVGVGKVLTLTRVPTADAAGKIHYTDAKILFAVSDTGALSLAAAPSFMKSPKLVTDHFVAGRYYVKSGNAAIQFGTLSYGVGDGGSTVWTLPMDNAPDADYPDQATWQTGALAPDVAARLNNAKVPNNPDYSYGTMPVGEGSSAFYHNNGLLAAEQVGSDLTLISYTGYGNGDQSGQQGSIIMVLCADNTCSNAPM